MYEYPPFIVDSNKYCIAEDMEAAEEFNLVFLLLIRLKSLLVSLFANTAT